MTRLTVGPVIGKVSDTRARIAAEVNGDATVTCVLEDAAGNQFTQQKHLQRNRFTAWEFAGLQPATRYTVGFTGAESDMTGTFRTFHAAPTRMNIAAVSCNFNVMRDDTNLWADLRDRNVLPGNVDLLLHLGDQIYGDAAFQEAERIVASRGRGAAARRQVRELYRRLYRMTWQDPATREVLANVPNLMIWDDHEIRDDWGSRKEDHDRSSVAHHIGRLAQDVFREYQRVLWQDEASWPAQRFEDHFHKWGTIGVLFVDQRGGRSFERDDTRPYLGVPQWSRVSSALAPGGYFDDVRALVVVTSVPLVYLSDSITNGGSGAVDDLRDHWAYGAHRAEQVQMLRALRSWKAAGGREVLVVGGDVHIGLHTQITHNDARIFDQLITSPITNKPPNWFAYTALKALLESDETLSSRYGFEHSRYTRNRNYGFVLARIPNDPHTPPVLSGGLEQP